MSRPAHAYIEAFPHLFYQASYALLSNGVGLRVLVGKEGDFEFEDAES